MKSNHIRSLVLTLSIAICFATLLPIFGLGATATVSDIADKDTFVNSYFPNTNYGTADYAYVGNFSTTDETEAYYSFPFTNQPDAYSKAEISIYVIDSNVEVSVTFCLIENTWDESGISGVNWTTRVVHGQWIDDVVVPITNGMTGGRWITIDVTDKIGDTDDRITICINSTTGLNTKNIIVNTHESNSNLPKLVWTYNTPDVPGYDAVLIGIISITMIGLICRKLKIRS
jgi:hypothetical protein